MVGFAEASGLRSGVAPRISAHHHHQQAAASETAGAGVTYQWTPKISIGANLQISYNTAAGTPSTTTASFGQLGASQKTYSAGANVAYAITPFLAANLSYQYYRSLQANVQTDTSVILLALNFNPI